MVQWAFKVNPVRYPYLEMLHCSLNGVKLSGTQAKIAKGQGMLSGVPDLFLPVPKTVFTVFYRDEKRKRQSD